MKAILVIDVDDIKRYHADIYKEDDKHNGECIANYVQFKPLPRKKQKRTAHEIKGAVKNLIAIGYNRCLDDITDN